MDTLHLVLVDRDDLTGLVTWAECSLCGCSEMYTITDTSEQVWDGDPAACAACGAIDYWSVDEDGVHLARVSDDVDRPLQVLRQVFLDTGWQEWADRARTVDATTFQYVVVDGDSVTPLLDDDVNVDSPVREVQAEPSPV